jgi:hypothetical protein
LALAITAYDYDEGSMTSAAIAYQNNYLQIFSHHDEPNFGFALKT